MRLIMLLLLCINVVAYAWCKYEWILVFCNIRCCWCLTFFFRCLLLLLFLLLFASVVAIVVDVIVNNTQVLFHIHNESRKIEISAKYATKYLHSSIVKFSKNFLFHFFYAQTNLQAAAVQFSYLWREKCKKIKAPLFMLFCIFIWNFFYL